MERDYITIAEYAEIRGISKQAVYQALNTKLKPFYMEIETEGKPQKVLKIGVLSGAELERFNKGLNQFNNQVDSRVSSAESQPTPPKFDPTQRAFDLLESQLKEKDRLIEELRQTIAAKDTHIQEQSSRLAELLAVSQELQRNNQVLLRLAQGEPQQPAPGVQGEEIPPDNAGHGDEEKPAESRRPAAEVEPAEPPQTDRKKAGFFARLFGRG